MTSRVLEHRLFPFKSRFLIGGGSWEQSIHESFISNFGILGLEMISDSCIYVPAPAVRLMKSRVLSRPGVNSVQVSSSFLFSWKRPVDTLLPA